MRDIVGKRKIFYVISVTCLVIIFASAFIFGVPMDIQFKGGSVVTYSYTGQVDVNEASAMIRDIVGQANVQESEDVATGLNALVVTVAGNDNLTTELHEELTGALINTYAQNEMKLEQTSNVDPVMGKEFFLKCMVAIAFASLLMVVYIAFRFRKIGGWSAGAMCVFALLHDMVWVFAAFLMLRIPLNDNFIASALTILGYSINNTIVIYDRIRENKRILGGDTALDVLVNTSINQTLKRSVMTTITTLIALVTICVVAVINGLSSIISFAFPMMIGMIAGLYSSVCLAPEMWVSWKNRKTA